MLPNFYFGIRSAIKFQGNKMKSLVLISISLFILIGNTMAMNDTKSPRAKEKSKLERSQSRGPAFFSKNKRDKKLEETSNEVSYQRLMSLIKSNDLNALKSLITDNPDAILLTNEQGENIVFLLAATNNIKVLELMEGLVKPDRLLFAINARNNG